MISEVCGSELVSGNNMGYILAARIGGSRKWLNFLPHTLWCLENDFSKFIFFFKMITSCGEARGHAGHAKHDQKDFPENSCLFNGKFLDILKDGAFYI